MDGTFEINPRYSYDNNDSSECAGRIDGVKARLRHSNFHTRYAAAFQRERSAKYDHSRVIRGVFINHSRGAERGFPPPLPSPPPAPSLATSTRVVDERISRRMTLLVSSIRAFGNSSRSRFKRGAIHTLRATFPFAFVRIITCVDWPYSATSRCSLMYLNLDRLLLAIDFREAMRRLRPNGETARRALISSMQTLARTTSCTTAHNGKNFADSRCPD